MVCISFSYSVASNKTQHRPWEGENLGESERYIARTNDHVPTVLSLSFYSIFKFSGEEVWLHAYLTFLLWSVEMDPYVAKYVAHAHLWDNGSAHWTTWTEMKSVVTQRELRMLFRKRRKDLSLLYKLKQHVSSIEATLQSGELSQNQTNVIPLTGITFNSLDACTDWCLKGTIWHLKYIWC